MRKLNMYLIHMINMYILGNEYVEYKGPNPPDRKKHYYYFLLYKHEKALSKTALTAYAGGNMCNPGYEERQVVFNPICVK